MKLAYGASYFIEKKMEKGQMMQFIKKDTDKECLNLGGIEAFAVAGDMIWGALVSFNALVKISMATWKVQYITQFPEEESDAVRLFGGAVYYDEKVIFSPMRAQNIVVYDTAKSSFQTIPLDMAIVKSNKVYKKDYKTEDIFLYNGYAYIVGCSYPAIIKILLRDLSVEYITQPFEELDKKITDYSSGYFGCVTRQEDYLYAGCCLSGDILKFSLEDETYEIIETDFKGLDAVVEKENIWLLTSLTDRNGYRKRLGAYYEQIKDLNNILIVRVLCKGNMAYLFCFDDREGAKLLQYNFVSGQAAEIAGMEEGFYNAIRYENSILATCVLSGKIMEIDTEKEIIKEHVLSYSGTILRWLMRKRFAEEKEADDLKKYLAWVVAGDEI